MSRVAIGLAAVGLILCALLLWQSNAMPSYLAAWLVLMALPLGALPLVAAAELFGITENRFLAVLRRMLLMLPAGTVLAAPLVLGAGRLFGSGWLSPSALGIDMVAMLVIWSGLALLLFRPARRGPRAGLAALALMLHAVLGTVAAVGWVMALAPGFNSSAFGLLVIVTQSVTAASAALFALALGSRDQALPGAPGLLLTGLLGLWAFLHFTQYLVIWSANLPPEIIWYQQRAGGVGGVLIWSQAAVFLLAVALLATRLRRVPALAASVAAALLIAHLLEVFWFVTPAFRGRFTVWPPDALALLGLGGLAAGLLIVLIGPRAGSSNMPRVNMRQGEHAPS